MAFRDRDRKDYNAGIMYVGIGGFFAGFATKLSDGVGSPDGARVLPDHPRRSIGAAGADPRVPLVFHARRRTPTKTHWQPLLGILGAVLLFAILIDRAGLIISSALTMVVCSLGGWDFKVKEQLVNAVVMTAACVGIFYFGLGLPFRLFPWS